MGGWELVHAAIAGLEARIYCWRLEAAKPLEMVILDSSGEWAETTCLVFSAASICKAIMPTLHTKGRGGGKVSHEQGGRDIRAV
jgi:hypothetical protein